MKNVIFTFISLISFGQLALSQDRPVDTLPYFHNHEAWSHKRYEQMQAKLDSCIKYNDTIGLRFLSSQLETQLKLEDFLVRFREAEHTKFTTYFSIIWAAIASVLTALITLFIARKSGWK